MVPTTPRRVFGRHIRMPTPHMRSQISDLARLVLFTRTYGLSDFGVVSARFPAQTYTTVPESRRSVMGCPCPPVLPSPLRKTDCPTTRPKVHPHRQTSDYAGTHIVHPVDPRRMHDNVTIGQSSPHRTCVVHHHTIFGRGAGSHDSLYTRQASRLFFFLFYLVYFGSVAQGHSTVLWKYMT